MLVFVHRKEPPGFTLKRPWRLFFVNVSEKGPCHTLSTRLTSIFKKPRSLWKTWSHLMTIGLARAQELFHPAHFLFTDRLSHSVIYDAPPNSHPKKHSLFTIRREEKRAHDLLFSVPCLKKKHCCISVSSLISLYPSINLSPVLDVSVQPWRSVIMQQRTVTTWQCHQQWQWSRNGCAQRGKSGGP